MIVQEFLSKKGVPYDVIDHRPTYDAQSLAHAVHVSGEHVGKAVLLKADGEYMLAVLPATHSIDFAAVKTALAATDVQLASEQECGSQFGDCELGAQSPFGSEYALQTLVDESLLDSDEIVFEANTHRQAIRMNIEDFRRVERPRIANFARHH